MKRIFIFGAMLVGSILMANYSGFAETMIREAQVSELQGKVEWLRGGTLEWKSAVQDQKLGKNDRIRTGDDGQVTLRLDDGSTLQVFPGSEFSIRNLSRNSKDESTETLLAILKGKVRAQVSPLKGNSKFQIETPTCVASVRGTAFTVGVDPVTGEVTVTDENGQVDLIPTENQGEFLVELDGGDKVLVKYDPITGELEITCLEGPVKVTGPDGEEKELKPNEKVQWILEGQGNLLTPPGSEKSIVETINEPPSAS